MWASHFKLLVSCSLLLMANHVFSKKTSSLLLKWMVYVGRRPGGDHLSSVWTRKIHSGLVRFQWPHPASPTHPTAKPHATHHILDPAGPPESASVQRQVTRSTSRHMAPGSRSLHMPRRIIVYFEPCYKNSPLSESEQKALFERGGDGLVVGDVPWATGSSGVVQRKGRALWMDQVDCRMLGSLRS